MVITTQLQLRKVFWRTFPRLSRKKITDYSGEGKMYCTDTRCAWVDWVDNLSRNGVISKMLAEKAVLR
jgi:hypothetical protein